MFMLPEDVDTVRGIIRHYAWQEDFHELKSDKAKKARFHAEAIDPEKGSATGYVAKYISKISTVTLLMTKPMTKTVNC